MTSLQVVFLIVSAVTMFSALRVVTTRNMIHAALWLVVTLMGMAILFALLEARFFVVVQLLVYIGAIAILIIIGVMLTRNAAQDRTLSTNSWWWGAALASGALLAGIVWMLSTWSGFWTLQRVASTGGEDIAGLGKALVDPAGYLIPFEVASILLLAAMVGAIFIAGQRRDGRP